MKTTKNVVAVKVQKINASTIAKNTSSITSVAHSLTKKHLLWLSTSLTISDMIYIIRRILKNKKQFLIAINIANAIENSVSIEDEKNIMILAKKFDCSLRHGQILYKIVQLNFIDDNDYYRQICNEIAKLAGYN